MMREEASPPPSFISTLSWFAWLLLLLSLAGCGDPCRIDREKTEEVMKQARAAKVDAYLPDRWKQAQELIRRAESACGEGGLRRVFNLPSREADELFRQAREGAGRAVSEAQTMEGMLKQQALNARYSAGVAVEEVHVRSEGLRKHSEDPRIRDFLSRLDDLDRRLAELQSDLDRGDYLAVRGRGEKIREEAVALQAGRLPPTPGPSRSPGE